MTFATKKEASDPGRAKISTISSTMYITKDWKRGDLVKMHPNVPRNRKQEKRLANLRTGSMNIFHIGPNFIQCCQFWCEMLDSHSPQMIAARHLFELTSLEKCRSIPRLTGQPEGKKYKAKISTKYSPCKNVKRPERNVPCQSSLNPQEMDVPAFSWIMEIFMQYLFRVPIPHIPRTNLSTLLIIPQYSLHLMRVEVIGRWNFFVTVAKNAFASHHQLFRLSQMPICRKNAPSTF